MVRVMVFNVTFNNISVIVWRSVLLVVVEETGVLRENYQPSTSNCKTLSQNIVCIEYTSPLAGFVTKSTDHENQDMVIPRHIWLNDMV